MMWSIERQFRRYSAHLAASALVVVPVALHPCETTSQQPVSAYARVLLVPGPVASPEAVDSILFAHRDHRVVRVRILYADGHTERSLDSARISRVHDVRTARQNTAPPHRAAPGL